MELRAKKLLPVYQQIAVHFADLHDTPGRMVHTGVVRDVVPWAESRRWFFHRLRRLLIEQEQVRQLQAAQASLSVSEARAMIKVAFIVYIVMASMVMAYAVMADIVMAHTVMAHIVMAHIVMAHIVMAYI